MNTKKVLWINPSFLDYRIPLYAELNKQFSGEFHLLYSRVRIPERCHIKVEKALGKNAHFLDHEKRINLGTNSDFANKGISVPFPIGLYKRIKEIKPDIIIAEGFFQFTPWAVIYTIFHKKPLFIAYERTAHTEKNCPRWRKAYRKFINQFTTGYLANGILTKEYLNSLGIKSGRIQTGCMCADSYSLAKQVSIFPHQQKIKLSQQLQISLDKGITYIFVGRIIERKGLLYLLNSWKNHISNYPNDYLLIVGDGPLLKNFKQQFEDTPSIIFTGGIDYNEIYKYYAISDVFVIPTLEDNWSLVVPEAMACGLPIACSLYNGCHPELVQKDVNGVTFDPLQQESITKALDFFHGMDLDKMGAFSKKIESFFNPEKTAYRIARFISKKVNESFMYDVYSKN